MTPSPIKALNNAAEYRRCFGQANTPAWRDMYRGKFEYFIDAAKSARKARQYFRAGVPA